MREVRQCRVLMLLENNPYPQDSRVRREARTLAEAGYQVSVICPAAAEQGWREIVDGVYVCRFPAAPPANGVLGYCWEYVYSLTAIFLLSLFVCLRRGFDIVHTHNPPDMLVLIAGFYKLLGKRFIYDHHDLAPEMYNARFLNHGNQFLYKLLVWFEIASCRLANHVIATNQSYKEMEMRRGRVPEDRITVVRNGPDQNGWGTATPDGSLRPPGKVLLGYVGVMGFQDGVDYLLRALHCLVHGLKRTDFFCVLVGDGDACSSLKALTKELNLFDYVLFTGWVRSEEIARYIGATDICVVPDPSNPYNDRSTVIKIMEYMALRKPIVAFDLPEHRFSAQAAALYARPNDELEFAQAIAQLMDDPVRRQTMGLCGRKRIETELAWSYAQQNLLKAYRAVLPAP